MAIQLSVVINVMLCAVWYNLYNLKNGEGEEVLLGRVLL